jgi:hypothetical protein
MDRAYSADAPRIMSSWQTTVVSIVALLLGAGIAVTGVVMKDAGMTPIASMLIGGGLGMAGLHAGGGRASPQPPPPPPR